MELITDLYDEEDWRAANNEEEAWEPNMKKLKQETTAGLIGGQVGFRVKINDKLSCPFCNTLKKEVTYRELLVHAHGLATNNGSNQEEKMLHRVLIEYLMWSTELVQERAAVDVWM